jgi:hypothetical protein
VDRRRSCRSRTRDCLSPVHHSPQHPDLIGRGVMVRPSGSHRVPGPRYPASFGSLCRATSAPLFQSYSVSAAGSGLCRCGRGRPARPVEDRLVLAHRAWPHELKH